MKQKKPFSVLPPLRETKDRVIIESIPRMEWGKHRDTSFVRSAQLTLNALGGNYSYEFLMGICGAAFRLHFHPDWCPSAADVTTGFDVSKVLFRSLAYKCKLHTIDDQSFDDIKELYEEIIDQINRGIPIVAINLKEIPVWGVITGYLKNRPGILCRTYFDESAQYSLAEHAPWLSFFIEDKRKSLESQELFQNSLAIAVELARTSSFEQYFGGFNAFEMWINELNRHSLLIRYGAFEEHEVNLTLLYNLLDARRAAVTYLEEMNNKHPLQRGKMIIANYSKVLGLLDELANSELPPYDAGKEKWTPKIIGQQVDVLSQIKDLEKESIAWMEEELKTFVY